MSPAFFIDRPIFASVLSIILVLAGAVAMVNLPIAQFPDITPPQISVSAIYTGATKNDAGAEAEELYERFVSRGGGGKDFSGIIKMLDDSWKPPTEK